MKRTWNRQLDALRFSLVLAIVLVSPGAIAHAQQPQEFGPWSRPVNLGPTLNSACSDQFPALSKDGLSLFFASDRDGAGGCFGALGALHLWVSRRDCVDPTDFTCDWQTPAPLTALNSLLQDSAPNLTTDGHWLFFHSRRQDGCNGDGSQELWASHRQNKLDDFGWENPINLGCVLNIPSASEAGPTFWEDDVTGALNLYFARDLLPFGPNSDPAANGADIYVSQCTADLATCNRQQLWSPAAKVEEVSSAVRDTRTALRRRDGLELIISSARSGGAGDIDLWVSTRASALDLWSTPINLNQDNVNKHDSVNVVNTSASEGAPALSWDGQTLIFYSSRAGGNGGTDLYMSTRLKIIDP